MSWTERQVPAPQAIRWLSIALILFLLIGCGPSGGGGGDGGGGGGSTIFNYKARLDFRAGPGPYWIVSADFDRDGNPDILASNPNGNGLSLLFWEEAKFYNTTGVFPNLLAGLNPEAVIAADLDSNLWPDIVTLNPFDSSFHVLMAQGTGAFGQAVRNPLDNPAIHVAEGDFNEDGNPDLLLAENTNGTLFLVEGEGNGNFNLSGNRIDIEGTPSFIVTDYFDTDDHLDVAVTDDTNDELVVLRGDGSGNFTQVGRYDVGIQPCWIVSGMFNSGDSNLDLAVACAGDGSAHIFLGTVGGLFTQQGPGSFSVGGSPNAVTAADYDGDGSLDLALSDPGGPRLAVFSGNGDGTFLSQSADYPMDGEPASILSIDVDQNGDFDLVAADRFVNSQHISSFINDGKGTFYISGPLEVQDLPSCIVVDDFNLDGLDDVAVANSGSNSVTVYLKNPGGGATMMNPVPVGATPSAIGSGEFTGDPYPDLVVANGGGGNVTLLRGSFSGEFTNLSSSEVQDSPSDLIVADFNADGIKDVIVANSGSGSFSFLKGTSTGFLNDAIHYSAGGQPVGVAAGFYNGDAFRDVAVLDFSSGQVLVFLWEVPDGFDPDFSSFPAAAMPLAIASLDADQNGFTDLAVTSGSQGVVLLAGDGFGSFTQGGELTAGAWPVDIISGDFNGDFIPDLATANNQEGNISILIGHGDLTFEGAVSFGVGVAPSSLGAGDLLGSGGHLDFACPDGAGSELHLVISFF